MNPTAGVQTSYIDDKLNLAYVCKLKLVYQLEKNTFYFVVRVKGYS